ncbi:MAG: hypothetical protein AAFN78_15560, partial [Pseudomonadota bacterium]
PVVVFLIVAAADGNIDKKELKAFAKTLGNPDFAILTAAMQQSGCSLQELIVDAQSRMTDPVSELTAIAELLNTRFPADAASAYKVALLMLGKAVAEASGGFLGLFGSKIDKDEKAALAVIAHVLGLTGDGNAGSAQATPAPSDDEDPLTAGNLFPAFKPAEWAESAKDAVAMQSVYLNGQVVPNEPVVSYAFDRPETVAFLESSRIGDSCTLEQVHTAAMRNLEDRLAGAVHWEELRFDPGHDSVAEVHGLVLNGDYFAAEALLSEKTMRAAHERMDSAMLMAIAPARGELYVTKLLNEEFNNDDPEQLAGILFAHFALSRFFNPEQAPIAPTIWIVRNGRVVGTVGGMDLVAESARKSAAKREEEEAALLEHKATLANTAGGRELQIAAVAKDLDVLMRNLQHVIRGYVMEVVKAPDFDGNVRVTVEMAASDYNDSMHGDVSQAINEMCAFLTQQFAALQKRGSDGNAITVTGNVARAKAA